MKTTQVRYEITIRQVPLDPAIPIRESSTALLTTIPHPQYEHVDEMIGNAASNLAKGMLNIPTRPEEGGRG